MTDWRALLTGIRTRSPEETEALGQALACALPDDSVLALHGDLGAGKTTFVRGLARGLGIRETIRSPSFNLYFIYQGKRQLVHCDAYRLEDSSDFDDLLLEDFLQPPWILALEWPERACSPLLGDAWHLHLALDVETQAHHLRLEQPPRPGASR